MDILINEQPLKVPTGLSREELWDYIEEAAADRGELVIDVLSDGEALSYEDFLTLPEAVELQVTTGTRYELGRQVLAQLVEDTRALDAALKVGDFDVRRLADFFDEGRKITVMLSQGFPEWLADQPLSQAAVEGAELCRPGSYPNPAALAAVLDRWTAALTEGVCEMDQYWRAEREDGE